MNKLLKTFGAILTVAGIVGLIWGVSAFWHNYCAEEQIHENLQAAEIEEVYDTAILAMQKSNLVIMQQRANWLEEQLVYYERQHGCKDSGQTGSCTDRIWRTYKKYLIEYNDLQKEIRKAVKN